MSLTFSIKKTSLAGLSTEAALLFSINGKLPNSGRSLDDANRLAVEKLLQGKGSEQGKIISLTVANASKKLLTHIYVAQLGNAKSKSAPTAKEFRSLSNKASRKIIAAGHKDLSVFLDQLALETEGSAGSSKSKPKHTSELLTIELERAAYRYAKTFSKPASKTAKLARIIYAGGSTAENKTIRAGIASGQALAKGINAARELGNLPANYCTPAMLGDFAKSLASEYDNLTVKVLGLKAIEKLKMGSFLSVARGSEEEPRFIVFEYKGKTSAKPNVIVGKGITFDTGGISLKPGPAMDEMKFDMCGAASVFGTIEALAAMRAKAHVVGIVAAAENMPSGCATKPGDVVTSMSGRTIEVLNTDAEGRLILCDALTYAERFKPKSVINIATLTGAIIVALGNQASGLFANNQELADKLLSSGEASGDRAWQMPLWEEYHDSLKSNFADVANIGGRQAGSVTAACFLAKFTEAYPWAHLDVAGTASDSGAAKGATGRPVSLLVDYLINNA